ncbi:erythropoietin receptor [Heteronotia binoei]|uniref:erythropoietin receptor n=1 Tax=Heteronotia binoei TaxID=13085 RepID=UPI00292E3D55|nr:erythropoietin receptor [Heteronotia binoei]
MEEPGGTRWEAAFLALLLWASGSSPGGAAFLGTGFDYKAARVLTDEESSPKCFSQNLEDLACLWEMPQPPGGEGQNRTVYSFLYKFEDETTLKSCDLRVETTAWNTTRYTCLFQRGHIAAFSPIEVHVLEGQQASNTSLFSRKVLLNQVVFLDPPSNLSVRLMDAPGQLNVSWQGPPLPFLGSSIIYEVKISPEGSSAQVLEVGNGRTSCLLTSLKGQSRYSLAVRAKPDGVSFNGYWSAWSQAVAVTTSSTVDPLILALSVILVLITLLLAFIALMSHRRFLKRKIWPAIPTPEHEFRDLFTIYKGNFQLWLGHQSVYLWCSQSPPLLEEQPFLLEILSKCGPPPPPPLPPKARGSAELPTSREASQDDEYLVLDEDVLPCGPEAGDSLLSEDGATSESSRGVAVGTQEASQASSSFEYTVLDPSSESLAPWECPAEPRLKSTYQMVSDSGISADYSPVGSNVGQAGLYTNLCEGGIQPPPFLPTYIVCT